MAKVIEWTVVCPECAHVQKYHSHKNTVDGKRRKKCDRCGRSFKAREQRLSNLPRRQKELEKEYEKKGKGFHKYSKS